MAARGNDKRQFQFLKGLNTECGPLTPAPNTWADGLNVVPKLDGSVRRRERIDFEDSYSYITPSNVSETDVSLLATSVGVWRAASGKGNLNFYCVQVGSTLYFRPNSDPTSGTATFTVSLTPYGVATTPIPLRFVPCSYAYGLGRFFVCSAAMDPIMLTLGDDEASVTVERISLQIRDFGGADDGLADSERPITLSNNHRYNLKNQGWSDEYIGYFNAGGLAWVGVTDTFYTGGTSTYPSNTDRQWWGDDSEPNGTGDSHWSYLGVNKQAALTATRAPRGRYLINPFSVNRSEVSGVPGVSSTAASLTRPSCIAFFAGRAWYSGVSSKEFGTSVFFSQTGLGTSLFGRCYQEADPTAKEDSDIVDTDGGVISIQEAGTIIKLVPLQDMMVVLCNNGVWQITSDGGFKATGYAVSKISNYGCVSADSVVEIGTQLFFWAESEIVMVQPDSASAAPKLTATPITDTTILTAYNEISPLAKKYAKGVHHMDEKRIYWSYFSGNPDGSTYNWRKDSLLVLDLRLGAFYKLQIGLFEDRANPFFVDLLMTEPVSRGTDQEIEVQSVGVPVEVNGEAVVISIPTLVAVGRVLRLISWKPTNSAGDNWLLTAADMLAEDDEYRRFRDWQKLIPGTGTLPGADYETFVETQWEEDGIGADRRFTNHYVTVFMSLTERIVTVPIIET